MSILIAWEMGSGLGHVGPLRAIGAELVRRGHRVILAAQNTELCRQAFAGSAVETLAAPALPRSSRRVFQQYANSTRGEPLFFSNGLN